MSLKNADRRNILAGGFAATTAAALQFALPRNSFADEPCATAPAPAFLPSGFVFSNVLPAAAQNANAHYFPGFKQQFIKTSGAVINVMVGGEGPPLMLIHGHPATHMMWHKTAPQLAKKFTVVMVDLRGYGDSSKPEGGANHINYSKKAMGQDLVEVMSTLGHEKFQAVGHDRGGRVLHAMMRYHPQAIERGVVLDIAPGGEMYAHTNFQFASKYFWWFFHIQAAPLPETMIAAVPEVYLKAHLDAQSKTPGAVTPDAFAEYLRCYTLPGCIHAVCEDYRAVVTIDQQELKENPAKATPPILALWGAKGTVGHTFDVLELWRKEAVNVQGYALPCGHLIPEEVPGPLLKALDGFLVS